MKNEIIEPKMATGVQKTQQVNKRATGLKTSEQRLLH